jgi:osmotically-inducible protein OsmY
MKKEAVRVPLAALAALAVASCGPVALGTTGVVLTRSVMQERTTMDALQDAEIKVSVNNRLLNHSTGLFGDVSVDVTEGRVVLTGSVPTREEKVRATELAWATPGVTAVTDELTVKEDSSTRAYLEDVWISNRLRIVLLGDSRISKVNYNVETVDKVVHLTGLARSRGELGEVIAHASAIPGVARVVSHVLTIDDPRRQATSATSATAAGAPTAG